MDEPSVRLMHYDPRWKQEFQQTKSSILHSCLGWVSEVQHIGSTAIQGIVAQPIIDVLAMVAASEVPAAEAIASASDLIEGLNFRRVETPAWATDTVVLQKPRHGETTHRVILVSQSIGPWENALAIRDLLQSDRELAFRFEETKVARWKNGQGDPLQYESDKSIFFTHLLDQIQSGN